MPWRRWFSPFSREGLGSLKLAVLSFLFLYLAFHIVVFNEGSEHYFLFILL